MCQKQIGDWWCYSNRFCGKESFQIHLGECNWVNGSILSKLPRGAKNLCYTFRLALGKWMLRESFRGVTVMDGVMWAFGHWERYDHLWSWLKIWSKLSLQNNQIISLKSVAMIPCYWMLLVGQTVDQAWMFVQNSPMWRASNEIKDKVFSLDDAFSSEKSLEGILRRNLSNMMHAAMLFIGLFQLQCPQSLCLSRLIKSVYFHIL